MFKFNNRANEIIRSKQGCSCSAGPPSDPSLTHKALAMHLHNSIIPIIQAWPVEDLVLAELNQDIEECNYAVLPGQLKPKPGQNTYREDFVHVQTAQTQLSLFLDDLVQLVKMDALSDVDIELGEVVCTKRVYFNCIEVLGVKGPKGTLCLSLLDVKVHHEGVITVFYRKPR
jgi:hypothetical protein